MNQPEAEAFAQRWIAAWNRHQLEPILSDYAEEIEVTRVIAHYRGGPSDQPA